MKIVVDFELFGDHLYIESAELAAASYDSCTYEGFSYIELIFTDADILSFNYGDATLTYHLTKSYNVLR